MNTLLSMAQIGCEEFTQPEYLTFYSSYEEYMKDLINWCNPLNAVGGYTINNEQQLPF